MTVMGGRYSYCCMTELLLLFFLTTGSWYVFENRKCQIILKSRETVNKTPSNLEMQFKLIKENF